MSIYGTTVWEDAMEVVIVSRITLTSAFILYHCDGSFIIECSVIFFQVEEASEFFRFHHIVKPIPFMRHILVIHKAFTLFETVVNIPLKVFLR